MWGIGDGLSVNCDKVREAGELFLSPGAPWGALGLVPENTEKIQTEMLHVSV